MPDLGGPELVRRLRQAHPHVAVLLVSGYAYEGVAALEGRDRPRFLAKPFTPEGLALQVREALDARERRTRSRND